METPLPNTVGQPPVLLSAVMCEDAAQSRSDGSVSLQRLLYVLRPAALPVKKDFVVVGLWWLRGEGQCAFSTRVRDVDGGVMLELAGEKTYAGQAIHVEYASFVGLEFQAGTYRVEVLLDGEVVGAYPLFVEAPVVAVGPAGVNELSAEVPVEVAPAGERA
jgi:hypothetical protein